MMGTKFGAGLVSLAFVLGIGAGLGTGYFLWKEAKGTRPESSNNTYAGQTGSLPRATGANGAARAEAVARVMPKDVQGQIAVLMATIEERNLEGRLDYYALLKDMTPEAAPEILKALKALGTKGHIITNEKRVFWERWGEIDGEAACETIFERDKRLAQTPFSMLTINAWARVDPLAASKWILSKEDVPLRDSMYKGFLNGLEEHDPEEAEQFIAAADLKGGVKAHGYWRVARQIRVDDGYEAVGEWYKKFTPDHPQYKSLTETVTDVWTHASVADSLAWGNTVEIDPKFAESARKRLHNRIAQTKPDQVVEHLALEADVESLVGAGYLVDRAVQRWIQTNPNAMGEWLAKNMDARNYDFVAEPFARHIVNEDPEAAAKWAATIRDPVTREKLNEMMELAP